MVAAPPNPISSIATSHSSSYPHHHHHSAQILPNSVQNYRCHDRSSSMPQPDSEWLQEQLKSLLASPYIHFKHPPQLAGRRFGHGPVDLFSTRFNQLFTDDATGVVGGKHVDKAGLKDALLAMQRKWHPDSADFASHEPAHSHQVLCIIKCPIRFL